MAKKNPEKAQSMSENVESLVKNSSEREIFHSVEEICDIIKKSI